MKINAWLVASIVATMRCFGFDPQARWEIEECRRREAYAAEADRCVAAVIAHMQDSQRRAEEFCRRKAV
jgi:hypothetical protein